MTDPYDRATMYGRYSLLDTNNPQKPYYEGWDGYSKTNLQRPVRLSDIFIELPDAQAQADDRAVLDGANERYVRALRDPKLMKQLELEELARRGANRQRVSEPQTSSWSWYTSDMKSYGNSEYDQAVRETEQQRRDLKDAATRIQQKTAEAQQKAAQPSYGNSEYNEALKRTMDKITLREAEAELRGERGSVRPSATDQMIIREIAALNELQKTRPEAVKELLKGSPRLLQIIQNGDSVRYLDEILEGYKSERGMFYKQPRYNAEGKPMGEPAKAPAPESNINNFAGNLNGSAKDPLKPNASAEINRVPMDNEGTQKMYGKVAQTATPNPTGDFNWENAGYAAAGAGTSAWKALMTPQGRANVISAIPMTVAGLLANHVAGEYGPAITERVVDSVGGYLGSLVDQAYQRRLNQEYDDIMKVINNE